MSNHLDARDLKDLHLWIYNRGSLSPHQIVLPIAYQFCIQTMVLNIFFTSRISYPDSRYVRGYQSETSSYEGILCGNRSKQSWTGGHSFPSIFPHPILSLFVNLRLLSLVHLLRLLVDIHNRLRIRKSYIPIPWWSGCPCPSMPMS